MRQRPRTRSECPRRRPCPWVGCQYHLYLDVYDNYLSFSHPDDQWYELVETCALDVADRGGVSIAELAVLLGSTFDRARAEVIAALVKLRAIDIEYDKPPATELLVEPLSERSGYQSLGDGGYRKVPVRYE